LIPGTSTIL
jgi:hypothetical protein